MIRSAQDVHDLSQGAQLSAKASTWAFRTNSNESFPIFDEDYASTYGLLHRDLLAMRIYDHCQAPTDKARSDLTPSTEESKRRTWLISH